MADPERLGKYVIKGPLGTGAMGVVYKGFDPHIERHVAIKTIRKDLVDPDLAMQYLARFRNEAKAAGRLHHPNIVAVYEYGEDASVTFIVMEYVEGRGLREFLNRRASFDFAQLVALMSQLLAALDFAHTNGVVHRDIKPSNLIVTNQGVLKVADFGIARVDLSNLTMAGVAMGTPSYMSPEQYRGLEVDARSDLFSTGVVLYELLTGERPFRGNLEAIGYAICNEQPAPPSSLSKFKLPQAVDELVATALAKDPAQRFPSARAFNAALHEIAQMTVPVDDSNGTTMVNIGTLMLQTPAPAWDDETLRTAEHELARALGPMAKLIVRRATQKTNDRAELCSLLSASIIDPDARHHFIEAFNRHGSGTLGSTGGRAARPTARGETGLSSSPSRLNAGASGGAKAGTPGTAQSSIQRAPLDQEFVDFVAGRLAVYLGPIAKIVAKKAAANTPTRVAFLKRVAENLGTQERTAFLREVGYGED
ncbi:MAG: serine/threonine-protein kinase [Betaproteobacteria bacterium]